jgi:hypothetical protein
MRWWLGREELSGFNVPLTVRGNQCPAVGSHVVQRNLTLPRSIVTFAAVVYLALPSVASSKEHRSREVTREFQREHPYPATGKTLGACPGYRKDHIKPLACGGPDAVWNLQWQTVRDAAAKDRWERRACTR